MFFNVKTELKINGKVYVPCVCYTLSEELEPTIKNLEAKGRAEIYEDYVHFMNGKPLIKVVQKAEKHKKTTKKAKVETPKEEALDDVIINEVKDPLDETETF